MKLVTLIIMYLFGLIVSVSTMHIMFPYEYRALGDFITMITWTIIFGILAYPYAERG